MRPILAVAAALLLSAGAASADPVAAPGREIHRVTKDLDFTYRYPAAAGRIPALKAWLDKDAAEERKGSAEDYKHDNGHYYRESMAQIEIYWLVVTDLSGWLSLSGEESAYYEGAAHPLSEQFALLWDKANKRKVQATDLFTSPAALSAAIRQPFWAELNRQKAQ